MSKTELFINFIFRLFVFSAEPFFVPFKIEITEFVRPKSEADSEGQVSITSRGFGETFQLGKHPQGTEVKAITYSAMQINEKENFAEIFLIIDI
jgi:SHS2 domain-containing protein